jgi:hypothetical protein
LNLLTEALKISEELDGVVFVGAIAVRAHTGRGRETQDIDLALASHTSEEELEKRGYLTYDENGKRVRRSPRGVRVDIYTKDVSGIEVAAISKTAKSKVVKPGRSIRVMCIEASLLSKLRSSRPSRPQDAEDIRELCTHRGAEIEWTVFGDLDATDMEIQRLKEIVRSLK